jgi:hypothetical protein
MQIVVPFLRRLNGGPVVRGQAFGDAPAHAGRVRADLRGALDSHGQALFAPECRVFTPHRRHARVGHVGARGWS